MIDIVIITKHESDRKTIIAQLSEQDDFRIINIGADGYDALRSVTTQHPDIIIMDFSMEDIDSQELAPIIKRKSPSTALIVLCSVEEQNVANKAFNAGISGCLPRQDITDSLASSIRSVFYGGLYISKLTREQSLNCFFMQTTDKKAKIEAFFSPTEQQIFYGIIYGRTDKEIAKNLNMSSGSLRNCINHVKKKTGLHNRTQIAVYAMFAGIINIEKIKKNFV